MNSAQLRHSAWNHEQLARAAETHVRYAASHSEGDMWNAIVILQLDCAELLQAEADRLDGTALLDFTATEQEAA